MKQRALRSISASQIKVFRIRNRRGWAAVCLDNLTEGKSAAEAVGRLKHPLRRMGYALPERLSRA